MSKIPLKRKSIPPIYFYLGALLLLVLAKLVENTDPVLHLSLLVLGGFILFIALVRFFRKY